MKKFVQIFIIILIFLNLAFSQWIQTSGPEGGAAFAIYQDGTNLYVGMSAAGVFRSTNNGLTWEQKINGMGYQTVTAISKCGSYILASGTVGVYRSNDDGETWTTTTGLPTANGVNSFAVIGSDVFAGTMGKGVYHSTDNGTTWMMASSGLPGGGTNTYVGSIVANGTTILVSASDWSSTITMYRSIDMGNSWSAASTGLPADYSIYNTMFLDESNIYAGGSYLYKTTNNGDTWTLAENGISNYSGISGIAANGSLVLASATNHLYRSTNGGASWAPVSGGLPLMNFTGVRIVGSTIYAGTIANGLYKSTDEGVTWNQIINGLKARDMSNFIINGSTLYANGNSVFKTSDDGNSWNNLRGNLKDSSSQPTLVYASGSTLFVSDYPAPGLERSTDSGVTWNQVGDGLSIYGGLQSMVSSGTSLLTAYNGRIYKSTNNGDSWSRTDSALGLFVNFNYVTSIGNTVYAHGMNVYRTTDEGVSWIRSDSGMAAYFQVDAIGFSGSYLFAGGIFGSTLYRSSNNGDTWQQRSPLPSNGAVTQFLGYGNDIFACSPNNGIFRSTNNGNNWIKISSDLPSTNYRYSFAIHNNWMFAGTSGNGVWRRPLGDIVGVTEIQPDIPAMSSLKQNYPNPFNPATTISFDIRNNSLVRLKVFNMLGQEVASFFNNEELNAGSYDIEFNANKLASGIYFYQLTVEEKNSDGSKAGSFTEIHKMSLLK
jgi:photosystem II stability/assembly factor-like uncharacterized protein